MNEKGEEGKNMRNKTNFKQEITLKKERRASKGITLIALVITIIVLLILAAVSIATLTGENGILTRANESKTETEKGEEEEAIRLAYNGVMADNLGNGITAKQLEDEMKANGYDVTAEEVDGKIKVTFGVPSNRVYEIDANGNIKEAGTGENPDGGQTGSVQPGEIVATTVKNNYTDSEGNKATVPAGFVVSKIPEEQKVSSGLVIYDIPEDKLADVDWTAKNDDGAYNVQTLYNQFVWIPVATGGEYIRDFSYPSYYGIQNIDYTPEGSTFTDTEYLPNEIQPTIPEETTDEEQIGLINEEAERNAVTKYNGFYIARYEAGKDTDGTTVISKQDVTVYTDKTQTGFKGIAKTMYTGSVVKSAMCSGIQWDMVMKFVDGKNDAKGNTYNVRAYDANRHNGSSTGVTGSGKNEYDKVQNIYDLEGNCYEYVAEKNDGSREFVLRGGNYSKDSNYRASKRTSYNDDANIGKTFRPALYIM